MPVFAFRDFALTAYGTPNASVGMLIAGGADPCGPARLSDGLLQPLFELRAIPVDELDDAVFVHG